MRLFLSPDGLSENSVICAPPTFESKPNRAIADSANLAPLCNSQRFVADSYRDTGSSIIALLCACSPLAVVRGVSRIIVYSLQAVIGGRPFPHVRKKSLKAIEPSVADSNAPASIAWVGGVSFIEASSFHCSVAAVFRSSIKAVRGLYSRCILKTKTAAGRCFPTGDLAPRCDMPISAIAVKKPHYAAGIVSTDRSYGGQPIELFSSYTLGELGKLNWCKMQISHYLDSFKTVVRGLPVGAGSPRIIPPNCIFIQHQASRRFA